VWSDIREEGVVWKCICTCLLSQWKMVEKPSCVLCEFILLKNEKDNIVLSLHNVLLHFL